MLNDIPAGIDSLNLLLSAERETEIKETINILSRMDNYDRSEFIKNRINEIKINGSNNEDIKIFSIAIKRGGFLRSLEAAVNPSLSKRKVRG